MACLLHVCYFLNVYVYHLECIFFFLKQYTLEKQISVLGPHYPLFFLENRKKTLTALVFNALWGSILI